MFKLSALLLVACLMASPALAVKSSLSLPPHMPKGAGLPVPTGEEGNRPALLQTERPGEMTPTAPPPPMASKAHPDPATASSENTNSHPRHHKKAYKAKP